MNQNLSNNSGSNEFGVLRSLLWPIHSNEYRKLIPMLAIIFLVSFVYNLLRCVKIALVVKAPNSGAYVVPFLKIGYVLPGALIFMYIYTIFSNRYSQEKVFYCMLSVFVGYFTLFLFLIYPNSSLLELSAFDDFWRNSPFIPEGLVGFSISVRHWALSIFYVVSELWGTVVLSTMFWGFANKVTKISEAKRFYGLFALGANSASIAGGKIGQLLTIREYNPAIFFGKTAWEQTVMLHVVTVIFVCGLIAYLFYWVNKYGYEKHEIEKESVSFSKSNEPKKEKISLKECFAYLIKSKYLLCVVTMVLSYNVVYNLADLLWTYQLEQTFTNKADLNVYMHGVTVITGVIATIFALSVSGNVVRKYGWLIAALLTPSIWFATSIGFFSSYALKDVTMNLITSPGGLVLLLSSIQIIVGRASKYSLFDPIKEIVFIPLSNENRIKAKAVVDGLASRLGKSAGAVIFLTLLAIFNNDVSKIVPYVGFMIFAIITLWMMAVFTLSKLMSEEGNTEDLVIVSDRAPDNFSGKSSTPRMST